LNIDPVTAAVVAVAGWLIVRRFLKGGKVSQNVVVDLIKAGAQIVDVRSPEEFRDGFYPGAVNIPVGELARRLAELEKDRAVVLYCASGARSSAAARLLRQAGYTEVVNAGGLGDMPR
jgi:rhodanese-related sulfurtransferase